MAWRIRIRADEGCEAQPFLSPDLVIHVAEDQAYFDHALAEPSETRNVGGLRSREGLMTAIILQIFSDARALDDDALPDDLDPDRRGWWGDGVGRAPEQGNYNLGSRLWVLRRSILDADTAARAADIVREALQPIVDQGAVAKFDIETETNYARLGYNAAETGMLMISIKGYDRDGGLAYAQKFDVLWQSVRELRGQQSRFAA